MLVESALIIGGVIASLITTICWNVRRSRCEKIESPCLSCVRKPMNAEEMQLDVLNRVYSEASTPKMTSHAMLTTSDMNRAHSEGNLEMANRPHKAT